MDDFVRVRLTQAGLSNLIKKFKGQRIDKESLYMLQDADIEKLIPIMGPRLKFKKLLSELKAEQTPNESTHHFSPHGHQNDEEATNITEVLPSTSDTGKRKSGQQLDSKGQSAPKRKCETNSSTETEAKILNDVRNMMGDICAMLQDDSDLNKLLKTKIKNLETEKKELVGVFGKTGAGKTSLINAVLQQRNLLPSGSVSACTSVMIKVEGNRLNEKYEAEIEFISPEDWEDELGSLHCITKKGNQEVQDNVDDSDEEYHDAVDKLSALYEEDWREKSCEQLMESKYFKEIPEFLQSTSKTLDFKSAKDLSANIVKYTRDAAKNENNKIKQWYWPLVKCVTVRVPNNPFLQHVTLVDLPGNGDRNKSRDTMWQGIVGDCSTVWVVAEINRAASEQESWDILKNVGSQIGNGGECRHIHIVCTKSDDIDDEPTKAETQALILKRNAKAKESVRREFNKLDKIKKHFSDECFQVFTVSSREFFRKRDLSPEDTEIPKLQEFLQNLNDCHSEILNYVSGAHGILSLIQGATRRKEDDRIKEVFEALEKNLTLQIESIENEMTKICNVFEGHLKEGVERSKEPYENILRTTLYPQKRDGRGFYKQLKKAVENRGVHQPKKGREMNININLTSALADSIDEEFRTTFPNDEKCGPFKGVIYSFSLVTKELKEKYKDVELQLVSIKSEEDRLKASLNKSIRKRKKTVYRSLVKNIEETMQDCYKKAAAFTGTGTLQNMRDTIRNHVHRSQDTMFETAKKVMMNHLNNLMMDVLKRLEDTMRESIEVSLKTDAFSFPDVSVQLEKVQNLCDELKSYQNTEHI